MRTEFEHAKVPSNEHPPEASVGPQQDGGQHETAHQRVSRFVEIDVASIVVGDRGRTELGDLTGLMASINAIGLLHPITVASEGNLLLAGARRLEACRRLGWRTIPTMLVQVDSPETRIKERCDGTER